MLYISGRERKIIELLLEATSTQSIHYLAKRLEVSDRTIHRDLKNVEDVLEIYFLTLLRKQGKGLEVIGEAIDKQRLRQAIVQTKHTDYTPDERKAIILLVLLEANFPLKLYTLASKLHVTEATVSNDLDLIESYISQKQLQLIRRRGYGIEIVGNEQEKRLLISELIKNYLTDVDVLTILRSDVVIENKHEENMIKNRLLHLINPDKLKLIEREVDKLKATDAYPYADSAYIGLVVHLALVVQRLEQGESIEFEETYLRKIVDTKEYRIAEKLVGQLEEVLGLTIPDAEIGYITMHLLGAKTQRDDTHLFDDGLGIAHQTKELIRMVSEALGRNLMNNYGLLNDLVAHLKPALFRIEKGMHISNPMLEEIKEHYAELFSIVQKRAKDTFSGIVFPEEEIGFLVLHFGAALLNSDERRELHVLVICPSGIGTAKILGERLIVKFPEIKEVHHLSYFELRPEHMERYDLIISTIALNEEIEYVLTSPMLKGEDIDRIQQVIKRKEILGEFAKSEKEISESSSGVKWKLRRLKTMRHYVHYSIKILEAFFIGRLKQNNGLDATMTAICEQLFSKDLIHDKDQMKEDLLTRLSISGLAIPETNLALFHARSTATTKISFSMFDLPDAYELEGMDSNLQEVGRLLVMISPVNPSAEALEVLSYLSGLIIKDEATVELFETTTEDRLFQFLEKSYNVFMNEKFEIG